MSESVMFGHYTHFIDRKGNGFGPMVWTFVPISLYFFPPGVPRFNYFLKMCNICPLNNTYLRSLANLPWALRDWENERKWPTIVGTLSLSQPLHHQLVLPYEAMPQSVLEASTITPLAPAWCSRNQTSYCKQYAVHPHFSQCRLRHWTFPGVQQGQATSNEITSLKQGVHD